tara:strand:- start:324 stop:530 length:207 start_codon:yes stop_codon:yes gene_type:complete
MRKLKIQQSVIIAVLAILIGELAFVLFLAIDLQSDLSDLNGIAAGLSGEINHSVTEMIRSARSYSGTD